MHASILRVRLALAVLALVCVPAIGAAAAPTPAFTDVLDMHGTPKDAQDRRFNIFFDAGAWHGYSLPPGNDRESGFTGPFVHSLADGRWAGTRFAQLALTDAGTHRQVSLTPLASHVEPGYLERRYTAPGLAVRQVLFFADAWHAVVRVELAADAAITLDVAVQQQAMRLPGARLAHDAGTVTQTFADSASALRTSVLGIDQARAAIDGDSYRIASQRPLVLKPGETVTFYVAQTLVYDAARETPPALDPDAAWHAHRARWDGYLKTLSSSHLKGLPDDVARHVAAKAMFTLLGNWRAARGDLHHDGVIPSYSNPDFNGFWAWDSWKHAVALADFAPDLARDQMRAMFDYQRADGMVPDCLYLDKAGNNWRDSKPPLATWATLAIYRATQDRAFVAEMYDKLVRYHRWWFQQRDHDHNGLAEFGATDGTRIAAAWESGMDNAVRFDHAAMVKNAEGAWSLDQESVDLNAYLYREKRDLAELAAVLGKTAEHDRWLQEADAMKAAIQQRMYDAQAGYFFDVKLGSDERVRVYGAEGWLPLWAELATPEQAQAVSHVMLDPAKFATVMPFPTLARDDPHFSPIKGYWRGPVWLDQAYFGVQALRRNGLGTAADDMARRLVLQAHGLTGKAPMYENYDPLTGHGYQSANFSWSAASFWLLLHDRQP